MSRTQGRFDADFANDDGIFFLPALPTHNTNNSTTPETVLTRNGSGDAGLAIVASKTYQFMIPIGELLFRGGQQDWLQEQFGAGLPFGAQGKRVPGQYTYLTSSATKGQSVSLAVKTSGNVVAGDYVTVDTVASGVQEICAVSSIPDSTHILVANLANNHSSGVPVTAFAYTTPAGVTGPPPFTGVTQFTPVTSPRPKGILFKSIYPWYQIGGAALTTNTVGLTQNVALNNVANAETDIITVGANGMATATQTNPYLTPVLVPSANQKWLTTKFAEYMIEWNVVTAASGTGTIYGVFVDARFNYN
jgi:hypothetical protein